MRLLNREKLEAWLKEQRSISAEKGRLSATRTAESLAYANVLDALDQFAVEDEPNEEGLPDGFVPVDVMGFLDDLRQEVYYSPLYNHLRDALHRRTREHPPQKED